MVAGLQLGEGVVRAVLGEKRIQVWGQPTRPFRSPVESHLARCTVVPAVKNGTNEPTEPAGLRYDVVVDESQHVAGGRTDSCVAGMAGTAHGGIDVATGHRERLCKLCDQGRLPGWIVVVDDKELPIREPIGLINE